MLPTVPDPTTTEWVTAAVAAGFVVVLGALLLLGPALRRSTATPWGRAGGLLLAVTSAGMVLVVAVAAVAGSRAGEVPAGAFAGVLVHDEADTAGRIAGYVAALLLPLAAVHAILAVAVVDVGRPSGLRAAAAGAASFVLIAGALIAIGDTGPAATGVASASVVLAAGTIAALALDEVLGNRQSRSSPASDSSTMSSQRSLQSRQR